MFDIHVSPCLLSRFISVMKSFEAGNVLEKYYAKNKAIIHLLAEKSVLFWMKSWWSQGKAFIDTDMVIERFSFSIYSKKVVWNCSINRPKEVNFVGGGCNRSLKKIFSHGPRFWSLHEPFELEILVFLA